MQGSKSSDKLLEAFAEKLAEAFVHGDLYVGDWSTETDARINLTIGPSSKKPLHIPLVEISSAEAAAHATGVFLDIALQAQSRKCRLHPAQYSNSSVELDPPRMTRPLTDRRPASPTSTEKQAKDEIRALRTELDNQKRRMVSPPEPNANSSPADVF